MKTQEWKDCYAYRNIGIRGSNAKSETGMKELRVKGSVLYACYTYTEKIALVLKKLLCLLLYGLQKPNMAVFFSEKRSQFW